MSAHGKHTANPGYKPGDNWVECDVCGMDIYASDSKKRWDGLVVCPEDWEVRHPQDFVRARKDKIAATVVRSAKDGIDVSASASGRSNIAGRAIAGIAIAGLTASTIPQGTFNPNTL